MRRVTRVVSPYKDKKLLADNSHMAKTQKRFINKIIDGFFEIATIEIGTILALLITIIILSINVSLILKIVLLALVVSVYLTVLIRTAKK